MRHILVLQWSGSTEVDFGALLEMEDVLEARFGEAGTVDGHDFGSGEMNLFIETDQPSEAFARAESILGDRAEWAGVRAASREATGEFYEVLWPPGLSDFKIK